MINDSNHAKIGDIGDHFGDRHFTGGGFSALNISKVASVKLRLLTIQKVAFDLFFKIWKKMMLMPFLYEFTLLKKLSIDS